MNANPHCCYTRHEIYPRGNPMRFTMILTLLSLSLGCNGDKADTGTDTDETAYNVYADMIDRLK